MTISFDTNVLLYSTERDLNGRPRIARHLLERAGRSNNAVLLMQTLFEFASAALGKWRVPAPEVHSAVTGWRAVFAVEIAVESDLYAALAAVRGHRLSYWDALLWATARRVGVTHLLSEDFQDGRVLDGVRFVNPFAAKNDRLIDQLLPA